MQKDFPVNHITEETVRTAHAEGRLKISLKAALSALRNEQHTQLYGCIEATAEEKERSVRYSPQELVDIMRYIKSLLPQLPEQLQADTKDELIIIARIPHILKANPQLASFQQKIIALARNASALEIGGPTTDIGGLYAQLAWASVDIVNWSEQDGAVTRVEQRRAVGARREEF